MWIYTLDTVVFHLPQRDQAFSDFPYKASPYPFSKVVGKQDFRFCNSQWQ